MGVNFIVDKEEYKRLQGMFLVCVNDKWCFHSEHKIRKGNSKYVKAKDIKLKDKLVDFVGNHVCVVDKLEVIKYDDEKKCLDSETKVKKANGKYVKVKNVKSGDKLISSKGKADVENNKPSCYGLCSSVCKGECVYYGK